MKKIHSHKSEILLVVLSADGRVLEEREESDLPTKCGLHTKRIHGPESWCVRLVDLQMTVFLVLSLISAVAPSKFVNDFFFLQWDNFLKLFL